MQKGTFPTDPKDLKQMAYMNADVHAFWAKSSDTGLVAQH